MAKQKRRDTTFPRHVHVWREMLIRECDSTDRTIFVMCDKCEELDRESLKYLDSSATAEFRRQVKHGLKPRFVRDGLVPVEWSTRK